jgi:CIC family chloride channel protein
LNLYTRVPPRFAVLTAGIVGAIVGAIAWFTPLAVGGGHHLAETVLEGNMILSLIPLWFLVRFVLSMASYGTGAPGGVFAPLLGLGALLGLGIGETAHLFLPTVVPIPAIFAVVGMGAFFTAIVRAPLTGIVLIIEMTGNYTQMLPLLVACFCAYAAAEGLGELPIYEKLLERDLAQTGESLAITEPQVLELEVEPGSYFDGKLVLELGLPPGCILVLCREGSHEWLPTATTRLVSHTRITAIVSPDATEGISILRKGCEAQEDQ